MEKPPEAALCHNLTLMRKHADLVTPRGNRVQPELSLARHPFRALLLGRRFRKSRSGRRAGSVDLCCTGQGDRRGGAYSSLVDFGCSTKGTFRGEAGNRATNRNARGSAPPPHRDLRLANSR